MRQAATACSAYLTESYMMQGRYARILTALHERFCYALQPYAELWQTAA